MPGLAILPASPTEGGWLSLAVLLNLFSREVVGWSACSRMTRHLAIDALQMALGRWNPQEGVLHRSDQGSQCASAEYQKILKEQRLTFSKTWKGNCYDSSVGESLFSRLKSEWVNHYWYRSKSAAIQSLFYYFEIFYNRLKAPYV